MVSEELINPKMCVSFHSPCDSLCLLRLKLFKYDNGSLLLQKYTVERAYSSTARHRHLRFDERIVFNRPIGPGNDFGSCCGNRELKRLWTIIFVYGNRKINHSFLGIRKPYTWKL